MSTRRAFCLNVSDLWCCAQPPKTELGPSPLPTTRPRPPPTSLLYDCMRGRCMRVNCLRCTQVNPSQTHNSGGAGAPYQGQSDSSAPASAETCFFCFCLTGVPGPRWKKPVPHKEKKHEARKQPEDDGGLPKTDLEVVRCSRALGLRAATSRDTAVQSKARRAAHATPVGPPGSKSGAPKFGLGQGS